LPHGLNELIDNPNPRLRSPRRRMVCALRPKSQSSARRRCGRGMTALGSQARPIEATLPPKDTSCPRGIQQSVDSLAPFWLYSLKKIHIWQLLAASLCAKSMLFNTIRGPAGPPDSPRIRHGLRPRTPFHRAQSFSPRVSAVVSSQEPLTPVRSRSGLEHEAR